MPISRGSRAASTYTEGKQLSTGREDFVRSQMLEEFQMSRENVSSTYYRNYLND